MSIRMRTSEFDFVVLSLGAFLETVYYGMFDCFAHDKMGKDCLSFSASYQVLNVMIN